jgi:hypothetical protein
MAWARAVLSPYVFHGLPKGAEPVADIDVKKAADEIKKYMEMKKYDLVDYSNDEVQLYPPPTSDDFPEIKKFSALWLAFFDDSDKAMLGMPDEEVGKGGFAEALGAASPELEVRLKEYDGITKAIEEAVNSDAEFWSKLREEIIPLYEKSLDYEGWQQRWKKIELGYDPCGLQATTTQMWTNPETGERTRGEVLHTTDYPAGFIVKIL